VVEAMVVDTMEVEAAGGKSAFLPLASELPGSLLAVLFLRLGVSFGRRQRLACSPAYLTPLS
jgi:hypothetical protein